MHYQVQQDKYSCGRFALNFALTVVDRDIESFHYQNHAEYEAFCARDGLCGGLVPEINARHPRTARKVLQRTVPRVSNWPHQGGSTQSMQKGAAPQLTGSG